MDNGARDELNRDLVEAMQELCSLAQVRVSASSQARVDRAVEAAIGRLEREQEEQPMNHAVLVNPTVGQVQPMPPAAPQRTQSRAPALTWLATAALLAVTLGLSYAAFGPIRLRPVNPPTFLSAVVQEGTPAGTTSDTPFEVAFPAPVLPAGRLHAWSTLYAVEPGVSAAYPGFDIESPVAALVWVQSGTMAIDGEHVALHRASAGIPSASPSQGEMLLDAGDAVGLELGPGHSYHLRSVGPEPLVFAEFWLVGGPRPEYAVTPGYQILDYHHLPTAATLASPATATMRLTRSVVAPEETLEPAEGTWQLVLSDPPSGHEGPLGKAKNYQSDAINVVIMTAAFQEVTATPTS